MGDDAVIAGFAPQCVQSCLDTLDAFCQQDCPVVTSYVSVQQIRKKTGDLAAQIASILGVDISIFDDPTKKLEDLGIDSFTKLELKHFFDANTDINLSLEDVRNSTLKDIKALIEKRMSKETNVVPLFSSDHVNLTPFLQHKEPLLVVQNYVPGDPIFIVSIGDVDVNYFQSLTIELKKPAFALVWTDDVPHTDIGSLASWYLKLIMERVTGPFHIVGYSLGGSVAFEMAMQSQNCEGNLKTITLISGSDDLMHALNKDDTETIDSQAIALCRFVEQFTSEDVEKLKTELLKDKNQDKRLQLVLRYLTDSSLQTVDKTKILEAITSYLQKYKLVLSYIPSGKLSMDINIIESSAKLLANDVSRVKELFAQAFHMYIFLLFQT
ncbi:Fatty acid synthase [Araneus ventricosus]|uniref:oleoyl-[acyl-carrier-protein] hydrolase n=1 Tax=Araneus ventricosus TaxID=182803 RepID=A0A4Y2GQP2_ARAVE|nr:Fatty acid synthase [Araneus ventricosus]